MLSKEVFANLNKSEFKRNWRITMKKSYSRLSLLFSFLGIIIIFLGIKQSSIIMFLGIVLLIATFVIGAIAVVKRERSSLIIWSLFIIFLFILPFVKPSNASFTDWLAVQHQFDCQNKACVSNTEDEKGFFLLKGLAFLVGTQLLHIKLYLNNNNETIKTCHFATKNRNHTTVRFRFFIYFNSFFIKS